MARKTYNEMLNDPAKENKVIDLTKTESPEAVALWGATMLVASPREYNELMKDVPKGKILTTDTMRTHLAKNIRQLVSAR